MDPFGEATAGTIFAAANYSEVFRDSQTSVILVPSSVTLTPGELTWHSVATRVRPGFAITWSYCSGCCGRKLDDDSPR